VGALSCPVIFNVQELAELFGTIASDLNYGSVYAHANLFKKGDAIQSSPTGDRISITMAGAVEGNIRSAAFDVDGLSLDRAQLVKDGVAVGYYGSNRFGQYLSETPTGNLGCLLVDAGKEHSDSWMTQSHLEILSMSGLQVDMNNDYIGGEIRLAWYFDGTTRIPVTGISVSGSLKAVLNSIKLSENTGIHNGYMGPAKALIPEMNIF